MSSVSLTSPRVFCLFICIFVHDLDWFSLLPIWLPWIWFSLVCVAGFERLLLNSCLLLGQQSVLWTVQREGPHLVLVSTALFRGSWGNCWTDCNFVCGFLFLSKNVLCDLRLRWCFEVLLPEPWRRQLQIDVFKHSSFFGKLKDRKEKPEVVKMPKNSPSLLCLIFFLATSNRKYAVYLQVLCLCIISGL